MAEQPQPQPPRITRTLFGEFMLLITVIILPLSLFIAWYAVESVNRMNTQQWFLMLENLADDKTSNITRYIDDHLTRVEMLSQMPTIQQAISAIDSGFAQGGVNSPLCRQASRRYAGFLTDYLWQWEYYDLFLINTKGDIVFSIKHEADFGSNLLDGPYRDSGLGILFRSAAHNLDVNNSGFEYYSPSQEEAAFVAAPILQDGRLIGVVALQFNTGAFHDVINDYVGLGATGEVVVGKRIDDHILITAPLRHDLNAAFKRKIALDADNALPIRESAQGVAGEGELIDWRGERVLAVWRYLPALQWGMVVKIDSDEAFGYWQTVQRRWFTVIGIALLSCYILIYLFTRRLVRPLNRLTELSRNYAQGDSAVAIDDLIATDNEIALLADGMRSMLLQVERSKEEQQLLVTELAESNRVLDRRVAEQTEEIRAVIEHAADGIIVIDALGVIKRVNHALLRIFGYSADELMGESVTVLMPPPYRDDHIACMERRRRADSDTSLDLSSEREGVRKSGEIFPLDIRVTEMRVGGERLFLGILRDITARRALEVEQRQLTLAVEQAQDAIFITDHEGVINYFNPAFERLSGFDANELIGSSAKLMKSGKMESSFYERMWQAILQGREWRAEFINRRRDGVLYEVDQSISPIKDQHDRVVGFVSVQRDITQDKLQREQLEHTQRLESLGVLAGGIAHDFNNLLTAILGNSALAKMRIDPTSPAIDMLTNVEKSSERAALLCKQMLAYSGKGKFVVESINLTELIHEMISLLNVSINKSVVMRLDLSEQLPNIEADTAQMQQIVMNLVINASEAIGNRSGIITIHTGAVEVDADYIATTYLKDNIAPGRFVMLEVSDTGCGMDSATQKRIFDPFFTTKFTGRGLGMSAILGIVRGHHGAIKVYSEEGKGTTFKILLPCSALRSNKIKRESQPKVNNSAAHGTVLIVDDEETIRVTAAAMLEDIGFTTLTAVDGVDGVATFKRHREEISVVLIDMTMPRMGGEELFCELRKIDPNIRVVLSSGYNEQDATSHFAGKGLAGFIQKPYRPQVLQAKIVDIVSPTTA
ncbi:MAG: PAS domain S-box protein [Mariprofundales bacterium]|nr:PAS domain S-box protein [Mariprofundales bacterium]